MSAIGISWQRQFEALKCLGDACLRMREPGNWYVSQDSVNIARRNGVRSGAFGNGETPEKAVQDHWRKYTAEDTVIEYRDLETSTMRYVSWNGFMWASVSPPK